MERPTVRPIALVAALLALLAGPVAAHAQDASPTAARYAVTDLGTLGGRLHLLARGTRPGQRRPSWARGHP